MSRAIGNKRGFSLIELSMVILVMGLVMAVGAQAWKIYIYKQRISGTYEKMNSIAAAMRTYHANTQRYPCPAKPGLSVDDPMEGKEDCAGVLTVPGARDTGVDEGNPGSPDLDKVLIGAVPYKTLGGKVIRYDGGEYQNIAGSFGIADTIDPWGDKITYAVTQNQTGNSFNPVWGAIDVRTENNTPLLDPSGSASFVLFSHGPNRVGAYMDGSQQLIPCTTGNATMDEENCDGDSTFTNGVMSLGPGTAYYDDLLYSQSSDVKGLWGGLAGPGYNGDIVNLNDGNVGIGTNTPGAKLEVGGGGDLGVQGVRALNLCDAAGANCFPPDFLGGPSLTDPASPPDLTLMSNTCGTDSYMTGIVGNKVQCLAAPSVTGTAITACTCPVDKAVAGFITNGTTWWARCMTVSTSVPSVICTCGIDCI